MRRIYMNWSFLVCLMRAMQQKPGTERVSTGVECFEVFRDIQGNAIVLLIASAQSHDYGDWLAAAPLPEIEVVVKQRRPTLGVKGNLKRERLIFNCGLARIASLVFWINEFYPDNPVARGILNRSLHNNLIGGAGSVGKCSCRKTSANYAGDCFGVSCHNGEPSRPVKGSSHKQPAR